MNALGFSSCQSVLVSGVCIHMAATSLPMLRLAGDLGTNLHILWCSFIFAIPICPDPAASCVVSKHNKEDLSADTTKNACRDDVHDHAPVRQGHERVSSLTPFEVACEPFASQLCLTSALTHGRFASSLCLSVSLSLCLSLSLSFCLSVFLSFSLSLFLHFPCSTPPESRQPRPQCPMWCVCCRVCPFGVGATLRSVGSCKPNPILQGVKTRLTHLSRDSRQTKRSIHDVFPGHRTPDPVPL